MTDAIDENFKPADIFRVVKVQTILDGEKPPEEGFYCSRYFEERSMVVHPITAKFLEEMEQNNREYLMYSSMSPESQSHVDMHPEDIFAQIDSPASSESKEEEIELPKVPEPKKISRKKRLRQQGKPMDNVVNLATDKEEPLTAKRGKTKFFIL